MSQTISNAIRALVDYAVERKLCQEDDRVYLTNRLLDAMDEDSYEPTDEVFSGDLEVILGTLLVSRSSSPVVASRPQRYRVAPMHSRREAEIMALASAWTERQSS